MSSPPRLRSYRGLIALNAVFLVALLVVTFAPQAVGQQAKTLRPRGEYTMVAGTVQGFTEDAIYIIDAANQELLALRWNRSDHRLSPIGYRDFRQDGLNKGRQGR